MADRLERLPRDPGRSSGGEEGGILRACREEIAESIKADDPCRIVLCKNATEALNLLLQGLPFSGETVLTTAAEHNSVLRPLYALERRGRIRLEIVSCDDQGRVREDEWCDKIRVHSPILAVLNHASNVTGAVNPAAKLLTYARSQGTLTLLDTSQTMGFLDLDVAKLGVDMLAFTGHKYLLGPPGTGGLYVRPGIDLQPVLVGGTGVRSDLLEMPPEMPARLEPGTPSIPLIAGLLFSLRWQKERPVPRAAMLNMLRLLEDGLRESSARVIGVEGERTPVLSFLLSGWDVEDVGYVLDRSYDIICRAGLHCAPLIHRHLGTDPKGTVRLSLSRFTTEEEIARTLSSIRSLRRETP